MSTSIEEELGNIDDSANSDTGHNEALNSRITEEEVLKCLKSLKDGKAPGPDGIPNEFYKFSADVILPLLTELFNYIFDSGTFPYEWSTAISA